MMGSLNGDSDTEKMSNVIKIPEGIGIVEDSGFESIGDAMKADIPDNPVPGNSTLICDDNIKFCDLQAELTDVSDKSKRRRTNNEADQQAEDDYNREKQNQTYKRLMHLLSKSKFYSKHIIEKLNKPAEEKKKIPPKEVPAIEKPSDDTSTPFKRSQRIASRKRKRYTSQKYISDDVQKRVKRKINLSHEEIEEELNAHSDSDNEKESAGTTFTNPKYFVGELWDYQKEGLQWLKVLYDNGLGGILADEMGLGKTIQVIALFCHLIERKQPGPYLVVAPLSTIPNWCSEFKRFSPELPVVLLYGTLAERERILKKIKIKFPVGTDFKTPPIVLTTYETVVRTPQLNRFNWRYIVVDEGQKIKNHETHLARALRKINSVNRLILTGTPLQNNLAELWALLNFLLPDIFDELDVFHSWFDAKKIQDDEGAKEFLQQEKEKNVMSSLREILKPFMLRREKANVYLNIPPKKEIIVYAPITELQRDLYIATLNRDYDMMTKVTPAPVIVDDENGVRPKRSCLKRHKHSNIYKNPYESLDGDSMDGFTDDNFNNYKQVSNEESRDQKKNDEEEGAIKMWKQYGNITQRNREFFINLKFTNRLAMYKKIINHPSLVHCPLGLDGLPMIDENLVTSSGKLLVLDAMLKKLFANGHKVLLFSTMTMILDVIGDYLNLRPWKYVRLDGSIRYEEREKIIHEFNNDPSILLFLITTRAGGVGLNLAAADTVIIYDSDWNPQADIQAMARCHRIGQTRPVVIYKLCTRGTLDEAIIRRAEAKRKLEKMVISKDIPFNINSADTILELIQFLNSSESQVVTSEKAVFTDAELEKLVDRSDLLMLMEQSRVEAERSKETTDT